MFCIILYRSVSDKPLLFSFMEMIQAYSFYINISPYIIGHTYSYTQKVGSPAIVKRPVRAMGRLVYQPLITLFDNLNFQNHSGVFGEQQSNIVLELSCNVTGTGGIKFIWMPLRTNLNSNGNSNQDCCVIVTNITLTTNSNSSMLISSDQLCSDDQATVSDSSIKLCTNNSDPGRRLELLVSFSSGTQRPVLDCNDQPDDGTNDGGNLSAKCIFVKKPNRIDTSVLSIPLTDTTQSATSFFVPKSSAVRSQTGQ